MECSDKTSERKKGRSEARESERTPVGKLSGKNDKGTPDRRLPKDTRYSFREACYGEQLPRRMTSIDWKITALFLQVNYGDL